jgi:hypothetical protein
MVGAGRLRGGVCVDGEDDRGQDTVKTDQRLRPDDMSFAAVQKHVAVLEKAGLLTELEQIWRGRIARLDELLASDPDQED